MRNIWLQRAAILAAPLGIVALEAGWIATEVGRQPWIIRGYLRVSDAVTPVSGLFGTFLAFTVLYIVLSGITVTLLKRHVFSTLEAP